MQNFCCEFCQIFENTYSVETIQVNRWMLNACYRGSICCCCFQLSPRIRGEYEQFNLTFDYVEHLRNLVGLNCVKEKFCYKKVLFHYFRKPSLVFYLNFLFQLVLGKERLVDQDLIFRSKQILNWFKQRIWFVNFSRGLFVEQNSFLNRNFG